MTPQARREREANEAANVLYDKLLRSHSPTSDIDMMRNALLTFADHEAEQAVAREWEEADRLVAEWEAAYPEDIFPPVKNAKAYYDGTLSVDRISAHMARHMARELRKQFKAAALRQGAREL